MDALAEPFLANDEPMLRRLARVRSRSFRPMAVYNAWLPRAALLSQAAEGAWVAQTSLYQEPRLAMDTGDAATSEKLPGWQQVGITIANCLIGAGALGMPFALRMAGWFGLVIVCTATFITCYTAKCLVWSFNTLNERDTDTHITTYDALVEHCFGRTGAIGMKVMTVAELYGGMVCMVVLHVVNWPTLLGLPPVLSPASVAAAEPDGEIELQAMVGMQVDTRVVVAGVMCACALPTLLVKVRFLSVFAVFGLVASCLLFAAACLVPLLAPPLAAGEACPRLDASVGEQDVMGHSLLHLDGIGVTTGLALFAFAGHATFPELHARMAPSQRAHFDKACDLGFSMAALFYCALGSIGYLVFGECTSDALTLNLMGSSATLGGLATLGVLLSTFTSISVLCVPVVRIVREGVDAATEAGRAAGCAHAPSPASVSAADEVLWRANDHLDEASEAVYHLEEALTLEHHPEGLSIPQTMPPTMLPTMPPTMPPTMASTVELIVGKPATGKSTKAEHDPTEGRGIFQPCDAVDVLIKIVLLALAAYLAVSVPNFGFAVSLMGAFTCMLMSFILPSACNLVVHWHVYSLNLLALNALVVCIGFAGMYVGVQSTLERA